MKFLVLCTIFVVVLLIGQQFVAADSGLDQLKTAVKNLEQNGDVKKIGEKAVEVLKTLGETYVPMIGEVENCVEAYESAKNIIENLH